MKKILATILFLFVSCGVNYAKEETDAFYFENWDAFRYEISSDHDEKVFIERLSARNLLKFTCDDIKGEISPFFEIRRHFTIEKWYLTTPGTGLLLHYFDYLTLAGNFQYTWVDVPESGYFRNPQRLDRNRFEANPVLGYKLPILEIDNRVISLYAVDEYVYDIEHGIPVRNEFGMGFMFEINKNIDLGFRWWHLDWVKDFDSDQLEVSAALRF